MKKFVLTPDILRQAVQCKTVDDILAKAKEYDEDITLAQAQRVFDMSHASGAVSDEELDNVAGGSGCIDYKRPDCPKCKTNAHVTELYYGAMSSGEYLCGKCGNMF